MSATSAVGFMIRSSYGERWFVGFGKTGRLQTAWSLAGATLFLPSDGGRQEQVALRLTERGDRWRQVVVRA